MSVDTVEDSILDLLKGLRVSKTRSIDSTAKDARERLWLNEVRKHGKMKALEDERLAQEHYSAWKTNGYYWDFSMPGFLAVYVMKRGVENANRLENVVLSTMVKPKLVSMMRSLHAQCKPLKVALWGGGPCLEATVIMRLVDNLQLVPELKVEFRNYEEEPAWQAGHSALNVNLTHLKCDLMDTPGCLPFWEEMGQQHIVIAWYVNEALRHIFPYNLKNQIVSTMYPGAADPLSNGITDGPCFLMGTPRNWNFPDMLAADELLQHALQVVDSPQQGEMRWKLVHP